jgi:Cu(I)/Ag(I) efflux system protein CusF
VKKTVALFAVAAISLAACGDKPASPGPHQATGTVTKVDGAKGAVTIQHGPVASMSWPGMTMTFGVKDKALLDKARPGAKVEFTFEQSGSDYMITEVK